VESGNAIFFTAPGRAELRPIPNAEPGPGELLIRSEVTLISPGTELRCLAGQQPGSIPFPFIPGYVIVGVVEKAGEGASVAPGTRVLSDGTRQLGIPSQWGGHVSHAIAHGNSVIPVPDSVTSERASAAKLAGIAMRGVKVANLQGGERVAVVGLGTIGTLSARLFHQAGATLAAFDTEPARVQAVASIGIDAHVVAGSLEVAIRSVFGGGADVVVDATGNPAVLPDSMLGAKIKPWGDSAAKGSKLVIQGSYPADFTLPYQEAFLRELTILLPRDTVRSDKEECMRLIESGDLFVDDLVAQRFDPSKAQEAYDGLIAHRFLTACFNWS
jgi:2-desacetyl-2-hydroxyethyl bacteriochlorophyllide A dehydrogenase